jgi:hypothetical protein
MTRTQWVILVISGLSAGTAAVGCTPGGVGDPCIPEDEYSPGFSGFGYAEANVESRSFQCETRVCIANHFQGRVSCPYGQTEAAIADPTNPAPGRCHVPAAPDEISVPVAPQAMDRRAETTVYCSCRCEGADKTAKYCSCPSGYSCLPLVPDLGLGQSQLAGKYCLKNGTEFTNIGGKYCNTALKNCPTDTLSNAAMNP